jgi:rubrerythrin
MNQDIILKLVYISKRMTIGVYCALSRIEHKNEREIIGDLLREEGKHTMMTVKILDELGIETPKKGGEIAERFGESIGKLSSVFGWRCMCFFMQFGEEAERLFLRAASGICRNRKDRKIFDLIIFDEKKHSRWWRKKLFQRRN